MYHSVDATQRVHWLFREHLQTKEFGIKVETDVQVNSISTFNSNDIASVPKWQLYFEIGTYKFFT